MNIIRNTTVTIVLAVAAFFGIDHYIDTHTPDASSAQAVEVAPAAAFTASTPESPFFALDPLPEEYTQFSVDVSIKGHQAEIDTCTGPVLSTYAVGKVIGEHNHCGGAWVLDLEVGDRVVISGLEAGTYVVNGSVDVKKGAKASDVLTFAPLYVQTCYFHNNDMRIVGLIRLAN